MIEGDGGFIVTEEQHKQILKDSKPVVEYLLAVFKLMKEIRRVS